MGYRAYILCNDYYICIGKFYGYVKDIDKLESIQWLIKWHKLEDAGYYDEPDIFNWCESGPELRFSPGEFRQFFDLYMKDCGINWLEKDQRIKEIYMNDKIKIMEWG